MAALTALAFALRLWGARSDLWLDEAWSLWLVSQAHSAGDILLRTNHDNNHLLNSLWMYVLGPSAGTVAYRLPAVLFGAFSVPACAWALRRAGANAMLAGMLLVATSDVMVEFSSQARGYSGFMLFELLSIGFARDLAAAATSREMWRSAWGLGAALGLGFLSFFLTAVMGFGLWVWILLVRIRGPAWKRSAVETMPLLLPTLLFVLPTAGCIVSGLSSFHLGNRQDFSLPMYWIGNAALYGLMLGIKPGTVQICILALLSSWTFFLSPLFLGDRSRWFYPLLIVLFPILICVFHPLNSANARYFLPFGVVALIGLAEALGLAAPLFYFRIALGGLALVLLFNIEATGRFLAEGREDYTPLMQHMARNGTLHYGTNQPEAVKAVLWYYGRKLGFTPVEVPQAQWCESPPRWLILTELAKTQPHAVVEGLMAKCHVTITAVSFPPHSLSYSAWHVYDVRAPAAP